MKKTITITTDFGDQFAAAQLKAIIASHGFFGTVIENHSVTPYSIEEGAFQITVVSQFTPKGTVHLGVVDPGVGGTRRGVIIQTRSEWFVGPDNGLLYKAAQKTGILKAWKIKESIIDPRAFTTFHGRDIFIKVAIYLAQNKKPSAFAVPIDSSSLIPIKFKFGQVIHIDHYGNVKVFYPNKILLNRKLIIKTKLKTLAIPAVNTFVDVPLGKPLVYLGSSNTLELAVNQGNASKLYTIRVGDILEINQGT